MRGRGEDGGWYCCEDLINRLLYKLGLPDAKYHH